MFIICKKYFTTVTYAIKDMADEEIKGRFYKPDLQLIIKEDNVYDVVKVLKTRRRNGKIAYYVKWKGYPDKFNSWIDSCSSRRRTLKFSGAKFPKEAIIYFCHVLMVYIVVITSIVNFCIIDKKYLPVVVTRKRKRRLSTSVPVDQ